MGCEAELFLVSPSELIVIEWRGNAKASCDVFVTAFTGSRDGRS